ncbi:MAG: hypothetical protein R3190_14695, partial [Thermoanaerobaculia bacterium]|nr:hypothetical protein [Thermoanaerobaculia bacterium]
MPDPSAGPPPLAGLEATLNAATRRQVGELARRWRRSEGSRRLLERDATLWTGGDEARWLGWLEPGAGFERALRRRWAETVAAASWRSVVLLGMGGSSLGAQLLAAAAAGVAGPELVVLDTTDPDEIVACSRGLDPAVTLFVVASKSGTTVETVSLESFFWAWAAERVGEAERGRAFLAVTDPGTELEARARARGYHLLIGSPEVGGRFSALTPFGLAVAAVLGVDVEAVLAGGRAERSRFTPDAGTAESPAVALGVVLAALAADGRAKMMVTSPAAAPSLGDWLEQLLAESTGKAGRGILPVPRGAGCAAAAADAVAVAWGSPADSGPDAPPSLTLEWPVATRHDGGQ